MSESKVNRYDEVPYDSHPFPQSHPDRLATIATLFGLKPAPVDHCRVLELGCASGGNLIPMALTLPQSAFVGVDLSRRQILDGQKILEAVGATNIELREQSILDVNADLGLFDYIICHGVYSWVPAAVQDKILDVCSRNLAPDGVAYVSYNTYPGWHMRETIREMMLYHCRHNTRPRDRVAQARSVLDFVFGSVEHENNSYSNLLKEEVELIRRVADSYLLHEHLEEVNDPVYFHQFAERAAAKRLQYLGEAEVGAMLPSKFPAKVAGQLQKLASDLIEMEQVMDFLRNRRFRQTLLCHDDRSVDRKLSPDRLATLRLAAPLKPASAQPNLAANVVEEFIGPKERKVSSGDPLYKAALLCLAEAWPRAVRFTDLVATARARLGQSAPRDPAETVAANHALGNTVLQGFIHGVVELHTHLPPLVLEVGERPVASPLARAQAANGAKATNLRHEEIALNDVERHVLRCLDGSRDRAALVEVLVELRAKNVMKVEQKGQAITDPALLRRVLGDLVGQSIDRLARSALLIG